MYLGRGQTDDGAGCGVDGRHGEKAEAAGVAAHLVELGLEARQTVLAGKRYKNR